jgi:hypothetical protein
MTYDAFDAAQDEMYERLSEELYPQHREQAVLEFTSERLRSYYSSNPLVMRPAVDAIQEGRLLMKNGHKAAALVFFVTAIEVLLKATLLKPVVHGLVHNEGLANAIVDQALGQTGVARYKDLLAKLFTELLDMDVNAIRIAGASSSLLVECAALQKERNAIVHQGAGVANDGAEQGLRVSVAVFELIVHPMLKKLELHVVDNGEIRRVGS